MSDRELTTGRHNVWTRILLSPVGEKMLFNKRQFNYFFTFHNGYQTKKKKQPWLCVSTFAGRVEQRGLERDDLHIVQVVLDGHLNRKASVWVHVGEGQQIGRAHKEVSVERVDGQTCRDGETKINKTEPKTLKHNIYLQKKLTRIMTKMCLNS